MNHSTERKIVVNISKVAGVCRLGDDIHDEVEVLSEYRVTDQIFRNTLDNFNQFIMVVNSTVEMAIDEEAQRPNRREDL